MDFWYGFTDGDNAVGQVFEAMKAAGVEEDTIVIFSAGNGPEWTGGEKLPDDHRSDGENLLTAEQRAKAFARWDTNSDGVLTLDEYQAGLKGESHLEARFRNFDKNGDGKLTREEFVISDPR